MDPVSLSAVIESAKSKIQNANGTVFAPTKRILPDIHFAVGRRGAFESCILNFAF
jgi:hypothetical protein